MRDWTLMLGERMMLCAWTADPSGQTSGKTADASASAARRAVIRQFARSWTMGPRPVLKTPRGSYGVATARLTIFSLCSLLISAAMSSLLIALLPNCSRNMPPLAPSTIEAW